MRLLIGLASCLALALALSVAAQVSDLPDLPQCVATTYPTVVGTRWALNSSGWPCQQAWSQQLTALSKLATAANDGQAQVSTCRSRLDTTAHIHLTGGAEPDAAPT